MKHVFVVILEGNILECNDRRVLRAFLSKEEAESWLDSRSYDAPLGVQRPEGPQGTYRAVDDGGIPFPRRDFYVESIPLGGE